MSGPPIFLTATTSNYKLMYWDKGSGANLDGAMYRPIPQNGFFIIGDYAQSDYNPPRASIITVSVQDDDPNNPILKAPTDYALIWTDKNSGAQMDGSVWQPLAPAGYVACGTVSQTGYDKPSIPEYRCIRLDMAKHGTIGGLIWNDQGSGADRDVALYLIPEINSFYAQSNYKPPTGIVWIPSVV